MCKSMHWNGKTTLMLWKMWIYTIMWWFSFRIWDTFQISNIRVENKISSVIDYFCCHCCCFAWKVDLVFYNKPYFLIKSYVQHHWRFHHLKPMGVKASAQYSIVLASSASLFCHPLWLKAVIYQSLFFIFLQNPEAVLLLLFLHADRLPT